MEAIVNEQRVLIPGSRWEISWSSVLGGTAVALGFFILFLLFGAALGLSIVDPYQVARNENAPVLSVATISWLMISSLAALFCGAWFSGHISKLGKESAMMQGAVLWGLSITLVAFAMEHIDFLSGRASPETKTLPMAYSSLNDREFANFIIERSRNWKPGNPEQPINVSVDATPSNPGITTNPNKVVSNKELKRFIEANTTLNKSQTEDFLEQEKNTIALAQASAQKRWEEQHSVDLAIADRQRRAAAALAWTLSAAAFLGLALAFTGSYVGWHSRDHALFAEVPR